MKPEVRKALLAANAAEDAIQCARLALTLVEADPTDWTFADQVYWLLRAAQRYCENTADALDPEEAAEDDALLYAHSTATWAADKACGYADELVAAAEAAGHEIWRYEGGI